MANPQVENGYVTYALELMAGKARHRLTGMENQFFEALMILTYGDWKNGKPKLIPYDPEKIREITGLTPSQVYKTKQSLISKLIIKISKKGYGRRELIGINKDFSQWKSQISKNGYPKIDMAISKNRYEAEPTPIIVNNKKKKKKYNKRTSDFHRRFWPAYPVKKSKQKAIALWESLASSGKLPPTDDIITAIEVQKKEKRDLLNANQFCPEWKHPTTWLYQGCWDDEPIVTNEQQQDEERERLCKMLDEEMEQERLRCGQPIQLNDWKAGSTKN